jgi:hypothetical protein
VGDGERDKLALPGLLAGDDALDAVLDHRHIEGEGCMDCASFAFANPGEGAADASAAQLEPFPHALAIIDRAELHAGLRVGRRRELGVAEAVTCARLELDRQAANAALARQRVERRRAASFEDIGRHRPIAEEQADALPLGLAAGGVVDPHRAGMAKLDPAAIIDNHDIAGRGSAAVLRVGRRVEGEQREQRGHDQAKAHGGTSPSAS